MSIVDSIMRVEAAGGNNFYMGAVAGAIYPQTSEDGNTINTYLREPTFAPVNMGGLVVVHMYYSNGAGRPQVIMVNGQRHYVGTGLGSMDLSGNLLIRFGITSSYDGALACRVWNTTGALPTDIEDILRARVVNPWSVTSNTITGVPLIANWECRIDSTIGQSAVDTSIKNQPNPGVGDLAVSGGGTLGQHLVLAVKGLS
jgi:hypothetical protein